MQKILYLFLFFPVFLHAQTIHINTPTNTICYGSFVNFKAIYTGVTIPHFQWQINSYKTGTDSSGFTTHTLNNNDTVSCLLINNLGNTVFAVSNKVVFTVQHLPVVTPIIGKDSVVCVGAMITFSDSTAGGVWGTSNNFATDSEGVITGVFGSDHYSLEYIYYIKTNACGSDTAQKSINVIGIPYSGFSVPNIICVGLQVLADDFEVDLQSRYGFVYSMSCSGMNSDFTCLYGEKAGTDYVYNTVTNVCGTSTSGQWVTVIDKPVITYLSSPEICLGETIKIIDSTDGKSPNWQSNGIAINDSGVVKALQPGIGTVTLSVSNQCGSTSKSTNITIRPPGTIKGTDSFCIGGAIKLTDTIKGGTWRSGNNDVAVIDQSGVITGISQGFAFVTYTLPSGCFDTGLIKVNECINTIAVFPNPSKYELTLQVDTNFFYAYSLINTIGQVILRKNVDGPITVINTQFFPPGVYIVTFYGHYDVHSVKFLKE